MASAKITKCKHFFHGVCLRKWLYVQDRCPLCHEIMMYVDNKSDEKSNLIDDHIEIDTVCIYLIKKNGNKVTYFYQMQDLQSPAIFNQFSAVTAMDEDTSSGPIRTASMIQGLAIPGTSNTSLHFRMSPAGGSEIQE